MFIICNYVKLCLYLVSSYFLLLLGSILFIDVYWKELAIVLFSNCFLLWLFRGRCVIFKELLVFFVVSVVVSIRVWLNLNYLNSGYCHCTNR